MSQQKDKNSLMQSSTEPALEDEKECKVHANYICPICQQLIFEPVVTSCGHSFCSSCLAKYIRHANAHQRTTACPSCRAPLPGRNAEKMPVARAFADMIEQTYPTEYQRRRDEVAAESIPQSINHPQNFELLGVFVLDATLPKQNLDLMVFEARYLYMVRQCLQGSRRFAMMARTPRVGEFGTEVEVVSATEVHYGTRIRARVRGLRVFRVEECWTHTQFAYWQIRANFEPPGTTTNTTDGGMIASDGVADETNAEANGGAVDANGGVNTGTDAANGGVNVVNRGGDGNGDGGVNERAVDANGGVNTGTNVTDGPGERTVSQTFDHLAQLSEIWMAKVRENKCEKYPGQLREILQSLGPLPPPGSPSDRVMWYAALLNPIPALGVAPEIRPRVLAATGNVSRQLAILVKGFKISMEYVNGYPMRVWVSRAFLVVMGCFLVYILFNTESGEIGSVHDAEQNEGVEVEGTFSLDGDDMDSLRQTGSGTGFYEL